jgi:hypothetical protein
MFVFYDEEVTEMKSFWEEPFDVTANPHENMKRILSSIWEKEISPEEGLRMIQAIIDRVTDERPFDWGWD